MDHPQSGRIQTQLTDTLQDGLFRRSGGRQHFVDTDAVRLKQHEIGEGAARVDADQWLPFVAHSPCCPPFEPLLESIPKGDMFERRNQPFVNPRPVPLASHTQVNRHGLINRFGGAGLHPTWHSKCRVGPSPTEMVLIMHH